ncbi:Spo0E family sporulation regulatory protein-aspartic acid phosphatase [Heyndrickxia sp. NPDC080065]|uniref:Spo0E family sporulation regulatory protein-aspartic acid phosphatase n=1 Tax=Heyndrickxia sp. NPDC080065 TaxID=3390568 RepID=UPI003CFBF339
MTNYLLEKELSKQINYLRQVIINTGLDKGLNHPDTVQKSQELDKLIVEYQILVNNNIHF